MSIFDTLAESGVTQEDLEKAASARLFAEAAATEGIDLSQLSEYQAEELYALWADDSEKNASADEFINAAASEGIDLNELTEGQVGELYNYWATGGEKVASAEELLKEAAVNEATAKLAEAEYIGRYMARVYADEMGKIAADSPSTAKTVGMVRGSYADAKTVAMPMSMANRAKRVGQQAHSLVGRLGEAASGGRLGRMDGRGAHALGYGLTGAAALGTALGAKKLLGRKKSGEDGEKQSSAFDAIVEERALELLKEAELAVTDAGHEAAGRRAGARTSYHTEQARAAEEYMKERPGLAHLTGEGLLGLNHRLAARHSDYQAGAHKDKRTLKGLNPFGGYLTKTQAEKGDASKRASAFDEVVTSAAYNLLKEAGLAVTDAGHRLEGRAARARENLHTEYARAGENYSKDAPGLSALQGDRAQALVHRLMARNSAYHGAKHEDKRMGLNPFGGLMTKTKAEKEDQSKTSSAFDDVIEARAMEMLEEAQFAEEIDAAALELLAANGY